MNKLVKYIIPLYLYALNIVFSFFIILGSFYQAGLEATASVSGFYVILAIFMFWPFSCIFEILGIVFTAICIARNSSRKGQILSIVFSIINLLKIGCLYWLFANNGISWQMWSISLAGIMIILELVIIGLQIQAYKNR